MIEPDTKDWTWVLRAPCPECGFAATDVDRTTIGTHIRDDAAGWLAILGDPGVGRRPDAGTWSPLEYAGHVRDVHRVFAERLALMLESDEPTFANWDQDATAVESRYDAADPAVVGPALVAAAEAVAAAYDGLRDAPEATWARRGLRSNGSEFTVDSLARYHLHDVVHHAHDVRASAGRATAAAYDGDAEAFSRGVAHLVEEVRTEIDWLAEAVGRDGSVLEIGSGGGRDALAFEQRGLTVRRTDVSTGFVERLRGLGHEADVLDPLVDDLVDARHGPYDGVWASASLLHVARLDLPRVLRRLAEATRAGGAFAASLKEGDGEEWSAHGHVRAPRRFVYWREEPLRGVLADAGWQVETCGHRTDPRGQGWLTVRATRSAVRPQPSSPGTSAAQ